MASNDKDFLAWIKKQYHNPETEISNLAKLRLQYTVPNGVKTWGDWYAKAGIQPPKKPVEKPKEKTAYELSLESRAGQYNQPPAPPSAYTIAVGQYQARQILAAEKPGTEAYDRALAAYKAAGGALSDVIETTQKTNQKVAAAAAVKKREGLVTALQRAKDYGTPKEIASAQSALDKFDQVNPPAKDTPPKDTKIPEVTMGYTSDKNGLILDPKGKPATGNYVMEDPKTHARTQYVLENGLIKPNSTYQTYDTKGNVTTYNTEGKEVTPSTKKETPTTPTPKATATVTPTVVKEKVTPTPTPAMGVGSDPKGIWISALKATFATGIDDPKQKKQIDDLIAKAKTEKWNEATFMQAMENTTWWKQTFPTLRSFFIESHDPRNAATFAQTMVNKVDTIQAKMDLLGIRVNDIDPVTGKVIDNTKIIQGIAAQALQNGWDDNQLSQHLATKSEIIFTGGGTLGSYIDTIKRQALNYGISLDSNQMSTINHDLLNPTDGKDAQWYLNNIKQQAIDANPAFAVSLKEGRTLYDVTSSYRKQMSDLLEVDPTNITWNDLMSKVMNKEKGVANTFADFTKQVKQDPLWQRTKNAKETYSNTALDLMKQFGFMG